MQKAIDFKSFLIGVLTVVLFFTAVGAKNENDANFNTITAKTIKIVNSEGKPVVILQSNGKGEGQLYINNKQGKHAAKLDAVGEEGKLVIYDKEGNYVVALGSFDGKGALVINNGHKPAIMLLKNKDGGMLTVYNEKGKGVVALSSNKGEGMVSVANKEGKIAIGLSSVNGNGRLDVFNRNGKETASVLTNTYNNGAIYLFDKYGNPGWYKIGKR